MKQPLTTAENGRPNLPLNLNERAMLALTLELGLGAGIEIQQIVKDVANSEMFFRWFKRDGNTHGETWDEAQTRFVSRGGLDLYRLAIGALGARRGVKL
jgi:hypothetical protein